MDRLEIVNNMALAAGMSYGKFMALHPEGVAIADDEEEDTESEELRPCEHCGKPIPHTVLPKGSIDRYERKKYCSHSCSMAAYYLRKGKETREEKRKKEKEVKLPGKCQWCGKQIPEKDAKGRRNRWTTKYCCNSCRQQAYYYRNNIDRRV